MNRNKMHRVNHLDDFDISYCKRYYSDVINRTNKDCYVTCLLCKKAMARGRRAG